MGESLKACKELSFKDVSTMIFAFYGRYLDMLQECCILLIALMLTYLGMFKVLLLHGLEIVYLIAYMGTICNQKHCF